MNIIDDDPEAEAVATAIEQIAANIPPGCHFAVVISDGSGDLVICGNHEAKSGSVELLKQAIAKLESE